MKIHCFYNDLILSLRCFFDRVIFPGGLIKNYQFNFGNRSIQLNYDTSFELPSIIINYRTSRPMFYHPYTFQKSPIGNNCNTIPVLYDYDKRLTLLLHEEHFEFNIEVLINCESQLSAIQVEHTLQNVLILNKFLQFYKFYSFLEIDQQFINSEMFDINHDHILNLFQKYNQLNDSTDHCFAVQYEPLIRMDSVDIQLGSTDQRSFQVSLNLTMMNPVPVYLEIPPLEKSVARPKLYREITNSIIALGDMPLVGIKIILNQGETPIVGTLSLPHLLQDDEEDENPNFIPSELDINSEFEITSTDGEIYTGRILGDITGVNYICKVNVNIGIVDMVCPGTIYRDYISGNAKLQLFGPINGVISNVTLSTDGGSKIVAGMFYGFIKSSRTPVNQKVKFEYTIDTFYYTSSALKVISDFDCYKMTAKLLPSGNLYNQLPELNSRLLKPKCEQIQIKKAIVSYADVVNIEVYPTSEVYCDSVGNFLFTFEMIADGVTNIVSISGKLYPDTLDVYYSLSFLGGSTQVTDSSVDVSALVFDFVFESAVGYGARYIDSINIDFADNTTGIASAYGSATKVINPDNRGDLISKRFLLRMYVLSKYDIDNVVEYDDSYGLSIIFDNQFDYDTLLETKNLSWVFIVSSELNLNERSKRYTNHCSEITIAERTEDSKSNIIEFLFDKPLYSIFTKTTIDNPIFFQIYDEGD